MRHLKVLFALTAAAALSACGGGGDSSTPPPSPPPAAPVPVPAPSPVVGTNGTLQTSVAAGSYGSDTRRLNAFDQLNAVRLGAGAGLLAQSTALDSSALDHSNYLSANGFNSADSVHDETSGLAGFTGTDPFARMKLQKYDYAYATEVIGDIGSTSSTSDCVGDLLDTVYHAASMLSRVVDVGFGFGTGAAAGMCTIDMASPLNGGAAQQIPPSGAIISYPSAGSTVAHGTFQVSHESPRVAAALLPGPTAGMPVLVGFRNQDLVAGGVATITVLTLANSAGAVVPTVIVADSAIQGIGLNADPELSDQLNSPGSGTRFVALVPLAPLVAGTYTVTLHATISGGQALALTTWSFTVAAL